MKKKNLILLLLFPFVIALLGIVSINLTFNLIDNDILDIRWEYDDVEAFKVNGQYKLNATGVNQSKYPAGAGNQLVWSIQEDGSNEAPCAEIISDNKGNYYLKTLSVGEVTIVCSNEKGTVSKKFSAIIYENGVVLANPVIKGSQNNIDSTIYYGEYDLVSQQKQKAENTLLPVGESTLACVYVTCVPWYRTTAVIQPVEIGKDDTVPRIGWGAFFQQNGKDMVDFTIQAHHGFVDGYHIHLFLEALSEHMERIIRLS